MRHRGWVIAVIVVILLLAFVYAASTVTISALPEPGGVETAFANRIKDWLIARGARSSPPPPQASGSAAVAAGGSLFGMACATCHGKDGRHPSSIGEAMYPRPVDLGAPSVQRMSDRELFWVVRNGIRMTGMPGFGKILTDRDIANITAYLRVLEQPSTP